MFDACSRFRTNVPFRQQLQTIARRRRVARGFQRLRLIDNKCVGTIAPTRPFTSDCCPNGNCFSTSPVSNRTAVSFVPMATKRMQEKEEMLNHVHQVDDDQLQCCPSTNNLQQRLHKSPRTIRGSIRTWSSRSNA